MSSQYKRDTLSSKLMEKRDWIAWEKQALTLSKDYGDVEKILQTGEEPDYLASALSQYKPDDFTYRLKSGKVALASLSHKLSELQRAGESTPGTTPVKNEFYPTYHPPIPSSLNMQSDSSSDDDDPTVNPPKSLSSTASTVAEEYSPGQHEVISYQIGNTWLSAIDFKLLRNDAIKSVNPKITSLNRYKQEFCMFLRESLGPDILAEIKIKQEWIEGYPRNNVTMLWKLIKSYCLSESNLVSITNLKTTFTKLTQEKNQSLIEYSEVFSARLLHLIEHGVSYKADELTEIFIEGITDPVLVKERENLKIMVEQQKILGAPEFWPTSWTKARAYFLLKEVKDSKVPKSNTSLFRPTSTVLNATFSDANKEEYVNGERGYVAFKDLRTDYKRQTYTMSNGSISVIPDFIPVYAVDATGKQVIYAANERQRNASNREKFLRHMTESNSFMSPTEKLHWETIVNGKNIHILNLQSESGGLTDSLGNIITSDIYSQRVICAISSNKLWAKDHVIYDPGATDSVVSNPSLLTNIRNIHPVWMTGIGGSQLVSQSGTMGPFGDTYYSPNSTYNIISQRKVKGNFYITFNNDLDQFELSSIESHDKIIIPVDDRGLYSISAENLVNHFVLLLGPRSSPTILNSSTKVLNQREKEILKRYQHLHAATGHYGDTPLCRLVDSGGILDCPLTSQQIRWAREILGECEACLKAKTTVSDLDTILLDSKDVYPIASDEDVIMADMMYVKSRVEGAPRGGDPHILTPYLVTVLVKNKHVTVTPMNQKTSTNISRILGQKVKAYRAKGWKINMVVTDGEANFRATTPNHNSNP